MFLCRWRELRQNVSFLKTEFLIVRRLHLREGTWKSLQSWRNQGGGGMHLTGFFLSFFFLLAPLLEMKVISKVN